MARRLTIDEKASAAQAAQAAEKARRPDAASIAVYVDSTANDDGTINYHAVIRVDAQVRWVSKTPPGQ